ncbi:helix-turn-helix transcriptional regulator, partial [Escherichia coli]
MMNALEVSMYRISKLLQETGWSQAELARRIGVTQQTVQQW